MHSSEPSESRTVNDSLSTCIPSPERGGKMNKISSGISLVVKHIFDNTMKQAMMSGK